jgi:transposase-like protein
MRPATWTEERLIHIDRQLHAGASIDDIAEHYGVSHHTIRSARKRGLAQGIGTPVPRSNMAARRRRPEPPPVNSTDPVAVNARVMAALRAAYPDGPPTYRTRLSQSNYVPPVASAIPQLDGRGW